MGGWAGLLLAHGVRLFARLSPWRSGGAAPPAVKVGLPMSAPHPRIVVLATGSIASVKVPALAVRLSKLAGSAAQVKIVTSTAGICARTHTRTLSLDEPSVHTYWRHACMHACRRMHERTGGTMLSKAAAYDSATWNTFQKLNIQVCLCTHVCEGCVCCVLCVVCCVLCVVCCVLCVVCCVLCVVCVYVCVCVCMCVLCVLCVVCVRACVHACVGAKMNVPVMHANT